MNGVEWIVEAHGCDPAALANQERLERLFASIVAAMDLHTLGKASWHQFPNTGGITGVSLLTESHLACHTFPEFGSACLNVFCCRPRPAADLEPLLQRELNATRVTIRQVERPYQA